MRPLLAIFIALSFACGGTNGPLTEPNTAVKTADDRGDEIVAEHLKREASPYRKDRVRFTVKEDGEEAEIFELDVWRRQAGDVTTTLSLITSPVEDAGSGSLTIEEKGKPAVNITYSVSRDEFRETGTEKMFFGGLTAQELLGEWRKYDYKLVAEPTTDGLSGFEVEGKLKSGEKSLIALNRIVFDSKDYLPVELHLFDAGGKELRTMTKGEIKSVDGRAYVARMDVVNHVYKSRIAIEILSREFPKTIDDAVFTREKLKQSVRK